MDKKVGHGSRHKGTTFRLNVWVTLGVEDKKKKRDRQLAEAESGREKGRKTKRRVHKKLTVRRQRTRERDKES